MFTLGVDSPVIENTLKQYKYTIFNVLKGDKSFFLMHFRPKLYKATVLRRWWPLRTSEAVANYVHAFYIDERGRSLRTNVAVVGSPGSDPTP